MIPIPWLRRQFQVSAPPCHYHRSCHLVRVQTSSASNQDHRGISFDTSPHGHQKSYTLKAKHPLFKFRRTNKTFLVGYNDDLESTKAIEWLFDEMIINGDTIVVLQVLDEKQHVSIDKSKVTISRKFVSSTKPPSVKQKRQSGQPLTNIAHQWWRLERTTTTAKSITGHSPNRRCQNTF